MFLFWSMVCFVMIFVVSIQVFLVSHLKMVVFKQKISDKRMFLFSNMVCFVLIIVF